MPRELLLVSCSGRMLAQSAARAGLSPVVLDGYADEDTRACARIVAAIPLGLTGFDEQALLDAATHLAAPACHPLVYGSGLDSTPALLQTLLVGRELIGNSPAVQRWLRTPELFFKLLDELGMGYPEIRWAQPRETDGWLVKAGCGEGGKRVRFCAQGSAGAGEYYQRRLPGPALSALFLADGADVHIIGFNTQWTVADSQRPFLFGGAINRTRLSPDQRKHVGSCIRALVSALGLRGLNSLDFMMDDRRCKILELNGRPSATLSLYDADFPDGLLAAHIRACRGRLACVTTRAGATVRAFRVFFAPKGCVVKPGATLPDWCVDRPVHPTDILAGQPFCTVTAEGCSVRQVQTLLEQRQAWLSHHFFVPH